ncbi:MAG TPA: abortive infection family protein [Puia sp.]|uniref:abortive infection family protein n=1 Tax=Puia sp. TaxID=2045100 RepID=UPI002C466D32|nr:abortive infection family protein [Puia sp.]HVU93736.1 abortive infection family protein [Puia sp.]
MKILVDDIFGSPSGAGYVMNFSNKTFQEFFDGEIGIDIYGPLYNSGSKANCLRTFLTKADGPLAAKALRALWEHRDAVYGPFDQNDGQHANKTKKFFEIVQGIEAATDVIPTDGIDKFAENETLEELVAAIERDIQAKKPQAALDRLHTYCMKKFAHLLQQRGEATDKDEALHSRAGRYIKLVEAEGRFDPMTIRIMKSSISIFDAYNSVRNNRSLAHDNTLVEKHEARFMFDSLVSILRFLKNLEASKFDGDKPDQGS